MDPDSERQKGWAARRRADVQGQPKNGRSKGGGCTGGSSQQQGGPWSWPHAHVRGAIFSQPCLLRAAAGARAAGTPLASPRPASQVRRKGQRPLAQGRVVSRQLASSSPRAALQFAAPCLPSHLLPPTAHPTTLPLQAHLQLDPLHQGISRQALQNQEQSCSICGVKSGRGEGAGRAGRGAGGGRGGVR